MYIHKLNQKISTSVPLLVNILQHNRNCQFAFIGRELSALLLLTGLLVGLGFVGFISHSCTSDGCRTHQACPCKTSWLFIAASCAGTNGKSILWCQVHGFIFGISTRRIKFKHNFEVRKEIYFGPNIIIEYEPDDFQLQLRVFLLSLTLQVNKTGSWSSD